MIKVFGHKAPDTDSACSAIIKAWLLSNEGKEAKPFLLGKSSLETQFVLDYWSVESPAVLESISGDDSVVIVDTNNPQELFENINDASILEIVDHHKLIPGLETDSPIAVTIKPVACTATIICEMSDMDVLPDIMKGLALSAIISDTLEFRSPTTTDLDRNMAKRLAKDLSVDIGEYASKMFAAKSDISDLSAEDLVLADSKLYEVEGKNLRVSVIETTNPKQIIDRKSEIVASIHNMSAKNQEVDEILLFVVDILKEEAVALAHNELSSLVLEKSFGLTIIGDTVILPGIVSRKKQILPVLTLK